MRRLTAKTVPCLLVAALTSCSALEPREYAGGPDAPTLAEDGSRGVYPRRSGYSPGIISAVPARDGHSSSVMPVAFEESVPPPAPAALPAAPGASRPVEGTTAGLTLEQLEQIAFENNPTLRQANALIRRAQGEWTQVGLYPNPTVGYTANEIGNNDDAGQQGFFVSQDVVTANKLELNRAVAVRDVQRAQWQAEAQQRRVLNGVRTQYFEVLAAQRRVEVAEQLEGVAAQGVTLAERLFQGQQSPRTDVLQARVELNTVQLLLQNARQQQDAARRQLASVLGVPELPPAPVAGDLEQAAPALDYESEWQRLQSESPLLQAARTQVERARARLTRAEVEPIPDIQLQGGIQQDFSSEYTIVNAQVGIALPVHNRNQGNITAAHADLHRAVDEVSRLELTLRNQLAAGFRRYETARSQAETYRSSILPMAGETLDLATQVYEAGQGDFFRVLTARRTYFESYVRYVAALAELRQAAVEIEGLLLTGGLGDPGEAGAAPPGEETEGNR